MTLRLSTFARTGMLGSTGFKALFDGGVIEIRSGPQPASADAAATGTLLALVTVGAGAFTPGSLINGLTFESPVGAVIQKTTGQPWEWVGITDGIAGWFRLRGNAADSGGDSTTLARLDGSIANSGADMNVVDVSIAAGVGDSISQFIYTLPDH